MKKVISKVRDNRITILALLVIIVLGCYFFIIVPQQKAAQAQKLQACLKSAGIDYVSAWSSACTNYQQQQQARSEAAYNYLTSTGLFSTQEASSLSSAIAPQANGTDSVSCSLPTPTADSIESDWHDEQNNCFKEYPVK